MFRADDYRDMYKNIMGPLSQTVTLMVNNGTDYDEYPVSAHVSKWRENELVNDGSIELGDLKLIILSEDLPAGLGLMGLRDRVDIEGKIYAVVSWDTFTRTIGSEEVAVQATVRGGGSA